MCKEDILFFNYSFILHLHSTFRRKLLEKKKIDIELIYFLLSMVILLVILYTHIYICTYMFFVRSYHTQKNDHNIYT